MAIGWKNWLFAGNDRAGQTAAMLYSLTASAERHSVDPQRYLTSVLAEIVTTPARELGQFLPDEWKRKEATARKAIAGTSLSTTPASENEQQGS